MTENKDEWKEMTDDYGHSSYFCSRCGTQEGKSYDVCPNCKADMRRKNKLKYKVINRGKCMLCGKELTEGLFFCKECEVKGGAE